MNKEHPNDSLEPKNSTNHTGKLKPNQVKSSSSLFSHGPQLHKRVLVVDDNSDIVFTLRIGLESDPTMQVYSYDNPVTALLEFEPNFYDLLLIDVNMPPLKSIGCFIKKPITAEQLLRHIKAELE